MTDIDTLLKTKLAGARRVAVVGAGSVLKADDAAGVRVVENLQAALAKSDHPDLLLCVGETAPENFSGKIEAFCPTHLLLIDAADVGRAPGDIVEIPPEAVGGPTFCSHMLPLRVMTDYLVHETGAAVTLLGLQYKSIAFDGEMTPEMKASVASLTDALLRALREL